MIDLLSAAQVLLREAEFDTRLISIDRVAVISFEDDAILGFCSIYDTASELLAGWRQREAACLARFAPNFHRAGDKAWNVYSAFLSGGYADDVESREVRWIEEDLDRTRKIAACGMASQADVVRALLPVLPLQYQPVLRTEDVTQRLENRIRSIAGRAADIALDPNVEPIEVIRLLGEAS